MKKTEKVFISMASLGVLLNNVAFATTEVVEESKGGFSTKYVFMGVAFLVIVLLLYLGYKMDTKGNESVKVSHKAEKTKQKLSEKAQAIKQNSGVYEADDDSYEDDGEFFDNDDFNDSTEYNDEEDSLYSTEEDNDTEENGTEFDTSIIDKLDEEEKDNNSFEDTMLFNNSGFSATGNSLEDEIDNLDSINDTKKEDISTEELDSINDTKKEDISTEENEIDIKDDDSFINEINNFEEPESSFEGFSVASNSKKLEEFDNTEEEKNFDFGNEEESLFSSMDDDFLSQMEANLKQNQKDRTSKKTTSKKSTTKKNDDK